MSNFIAERLMVEVANRVAIEKSLGRDVSDEACLELLEKGGKRAQLGDIRTWNGKQYQKTAKGWRPVSKKNESTAEKESEPEEKETLKNEGNTSARKLAVTQSFSRYEEKINNQIDKLREKLETAKKASENAAKIEEQLPGVLKDLGMEVMSTAFGVDNDDPSQSKFIIMAKLTKDIRIDATSAYSQAEQDSVYSRARTKAATFMGLIDSMFEEAGLAVNTDITPDNFIYRNKSEMNYPIHMTINIK